MELNEYQRLAMITNGQREHDAMLIMGAMGLLGETGEINDLMKKSRFHKHELSLDSLQSEIGDTMWYVALLCTALQFNLADVATELEYEIGAMRKAGPKEQQERLALTVLKLGVEAGEISKHLINTRYAHFWFGFAGASYYEELPLQHLKNRLGLFVRFVNVLCWLVGLSFDEMLEANISKLRKRYPEGFSSEASINREEYQASSVIE